MHFCELALLLKGSQTGLQVMAPQMERKIMAVSQKIDQKGRYQENNRRERGRR